MKTTWGCNFTPLEVTIHYPTGWMRIRCHLFFPDGTKRGAEQAFRLLHNNAPYQMNRFVIEDLRQWFPRAEAEAQAAWMRASQDYVNGWKLPDGLSRRCEKYKQIRAENERLSRALRKAKALSLRMQDRKRLFESYFG